MVTSDLHFPNGKNLAAKKHFGKTELYGLNKQKPALYKFLRAHCRAKRPISTAPACATLREFA